MSGAVSIVGQLATGVTGRRIIVNPAGGTDPEIRFMPGTGTNFARIWTGANAAIRLYSGNSPDGTRRSEVIQRGDEWRMHMVRTADGLAGGGYMFAQPSQLEVGYNDISGRLNRWLFNNGGGSATGYTTFRGTFSFEANAGLIMFARSLPEAPAPAASPYFVGFAVTLASTPRINITADNPIPERLAFHIRTPGTGGFTLRSSETASPGTNFTVQVHVWAWRQRGVT